MRTYELEIYKQHVFKQAFMVELYWSERESASDIAWNGYIDFSVMCLHWVAMSSDKDQREFSLSLQYNSTLTVITQTPL